MKIDLICNDGSPIGVIPPYIYGKGVGGAELSMMTLMETLAGRGHDVTVYNDPDRAEDFDGVHYLPKKLFEPRHKRDVLLVFRSPNAMLLGATAKLRKVWWSTDQYTIGNFKVLSELVDFAVTISAFHTGYLVRNYGIDPDKIGHIDLGVRQQDYSSEIKKVKNRMIFCSVPDRGLSILHSAWPLIHREIDDASLVITSDYRLWGAPAGNAEHRLHWAGLPGVEFLGAIPRADLAKHQMKAEILPYPCTYEELFCISVAEAQVAGAYPVTTPVGALATTNEYGVQVSENLQNPTGLQEGFVDRIVSLLTTDREYLKEKTASMKVAASVRFDWNRIADNWEHLFEHGRLP